MSWIEVAIAGLALIACALSVSRPPSAPRIALAFAIGARLRWPPAFGKIRYSLPTHKRPVYSVCVGFLDVSLPTPEILRFTKKGERR